MWLTCQRSLLTQFRRLRRVSGLALVGAGLWAGLVGCDPAVHETAPKLLDVAPLPEVNSTAEASLVPQPTPRDESLLDGEPLDTSLSIPPAEQSYLAKHTRVSEIARTLATACDGGDAQACTRLANLYETGVGAPVDPRRGLSLYSWACDQGRPEACRIAGMMSLAGRIIPRDAKRAGSLLQRACIMGLLPSCVQLSGLFWTGDGVKRRPQKALDLLVEACERGYTGSCVALASQSAAFRKAGLAVPVPKSKHGFAPPTAEMACPPLLHLSADSARDERLNVGLVGLDPSVLAEAFPARAGELERGELSLDGGDANQSVAASVRGVYRAGADEVLVGLVDQVWSCTLEPGTGDAMLALDPSWLEPRRAAAGGTDAAIRGAAMLTRREQRLRARHDSGRVIWTVWLGDRCMLSLESTGAGAEAGLGTVYDALDLDALKRQCASRDRSSRSAP